MGPDRRLRRASLGIARGSGPHDRFIRTFWVNTGEMGSDYRPGLLKREWHPALDNQPQSGRQNTRRDHPRPRHATTVVKSRKTHRCDDHLNPPTSAGHLLDTRRRVRSLVPIVRSHVGEPSFTIGHTRLLTHFLDACAPTKPMSCRGACECETGVADRLRRRVSGTR